MIPVYEPWIGNLELEYVVECVKSTWISSIGEYITKFEDGFSDFCGVKYGVSCSNGTSALHLALSALDIGKGDEAIMPALTFIATANAVTYTGTKAVFVDSDPNTWNIDPERIEEHISKNTKVIIPVHLYGHPAEMGAICDIAEDHGLYVIEDATEAHGAEYKGKKTGSLGDIGCFSFYGNKIITTGEGGMLVTEDGKLAEKAMYLRDHAMSAQRRYWHEHIGFNYRMTNIQAAIGLAQLERIDEVIQMKRRNAQIYNSFLKDVEGVTTPPEKRWAKNVYWMYSVLIETIHRDALMEELREQEIDTRPFFHPIHLLPPYTNHDTRLPVAEQLSRKGVNLPSSATLQYKDIEYVCTTIKSVMSDLWRR